MYILYPWFSNSRWTETILNLLDRIRFFIGFLYAFELSTYWVPLFKIFKEGGGDMAEEGLKHKLTAILSANAAARGGW